MPKVYHKDLPQNGELGIWQVEEDESYFLDRLDLHQLEQQQLAAIKGHLRLEWLASRWLLHQMSGRHQRAICLKDEFGKPYLKDASFEISISHSRELVTVMAAPYPLGVDIQKQVDKITRVQHKFMSEAELKSLLPATFLEQLHVYWGAKEALYKAYGRKQLDFITHIPVAPFSYQKTGGQTIGMVHKNDYRVSFDIFYEKIGQYFLVYALKSGVAP